ncbi:MAG: thiamine-phosphate kinase [Kineosporiaceae bacterium]
MPTVSDLGEDRLVAAVLARVREVAGAPVGRLLVGNGDDAAVLPAGGPTVLSTDTLVEHVDFRHDWSSPHDIGAKAAAAGLADVVAMGAHPEALLLSLTTPGDTDAELLLGIAAGAAGETVRAGATVAGGDVAAGREIVLTVTAAGRLAAGAVPVLRSGARPGHVLAVAGLLGDSGAGLAVLLAGAVTADRAVSSDRDPVTIAGAAVDRVVARHRRPVPPYEAGPVAAAAGATSLIDVSDGLVRDARRVAAASGVVLDLDPRALAPDDDLIVVGGLLGADPVSWVLTGGEDHALLATFPAAVPLPEGFRAIGRAVAARPGGEVLLGGLPYQGSGGFTHFAG